MFSHRTLTHFSLLVSASLILATNAQLERPLSADCNADQYGAPNLVDCEYAASWIPDFNSDKLFWPGWHWFTEPQFLEPPFSEVISRYNGPNSVQLPKIWKHGSCNIAFVLQRYRRPRSTVVGLTNPFQANWPDVSRQVKRVLQCVTKRGVSPQGGYTPYASKFSLPGTGLPANMISEK